ncbi:MAG: peptidylprolyl isomerase [Calditrichota bacterium]
MEKVKNNDKVKVHYTGKFKDGEVFDSSREGDPLEFQIGQGKLIPGFERAVLGMQPGESKTTEIPAADAYGKYQDDMVWDVPKSTLPDKFEPEVGKQLEGIQKDGSRLRMVIKDVSDDKVTLDANHPLAGKDLVFDIELLEIVGQN